MKRVALKIFEKLLAKMAKDEVTERHLEAFFRNPDSVFGITSAKLIGLVPKKFHSPLMYLQLAGDKPLYMVSCPRSEGMSNQGHVFFGKECIGVHDKVIDLKYASNHPLYIAKNGEKMRVVYGSISCPEYDEVEDVDLLKGQPVYTAKAEGVWSVCSPDGDSGERQVGRYDAVYNFRVLDDKLVFSAHRDGQQFVVFDGRTYRTFDEVQGPVGDAEGQPLYTAKIEGLWYMVRGSELVSHGHDTIAEISWVAGAALYSAWDKEDQAIFHGMDRLTKPFEVASCPAMTKDGLIFIAKAKGREGQFIVSGGQWSKRRFLQIDSEKCRPQFCEGQPLYVGQHCSGSQVVFGDEVGPHVDDIHDLQGVNGRPLYIAEEDGTFRVVHGQEEGRRYDDIFSLEVKNNVAVYGARQGRRLLLVRQTLS